MTSSSKLRKIAGALLLVFLVLLLAALTAVRIQRTGTAEESPPEGAGTPTAADSFGAGIDAGADTRTHAGTDTGAHPAAPAGAESVHRQSGRESFQPGRAQGYGGGRTVQNARLSVRQPG